MNWNNVERRGLRPNLSGSAASVQVMSGRPAIGGSVTITDPLRQHFQRASSSSSGPPNLIVNWVNRLEKLNATLDESGAPTDSQQQQQHRHSTSAASSTRLDSAAGRKHQSIVTIAGSEQQENDNDDDDDETESDFCFKAAQLATELLLMLFAAGLLVIATIVIFSKKIPDFMQSYEIVPKLLFFTCLIVAGYSFLSWSVRKIYAKCRARGDKSNEENGQPEVTTKTTKTPNSDRDTATASPEVNRRLSLDSNRSREGAYKRSSLQEPLLAHYSPTAAAAAAESHLDHLDRQTLLGQTASPPTRKVAFDASAHMLGGNDDQLPAHRLTIDEESDQEEEGEEGELGKMSRASA